MITLEDRISTILTRLEDDVQHDLVLRQQGRSGKSPKSVHRHAVQELLAIVKRENMEARLNEISNVQAFVGGQYVQIYIEKLGTVMPITDRHKQLKEALEKQ